MTPKLSREASVEELGSGAEGRSLGGHGENLGLYSVRWEPWDALGREGTGPDFGFHRIPLSAAWRMDSGGQREKQGSQWRRHRTGREWMMVVPEMGWEQ